MANVVRGAQGVLADMHEPPVALGAGDFLLQASAHRGRKGSSALVFFLYRSVRQCLPGGWLRFPGRLRRL
jgi:hypothetical protein